MCYIILVLRQITFLYRRHLDSLARLVCEPSVRARALAISHILSLSCCHDFCHPSKSNSNIEHTMYTPSVRAHIGTVLKEFPSFLAQH